MVQEILLRSRALTRVQALRIAHALCAEARILGYDPLIFLAVIHIESLYNPFAVSPGGAVGLMQLMPPTARWIASELDVSNRRNLADPVFNVRLGIHYLHLLHTQFHRLDDALTAYNRGPENARAILRNNGAMPREIKAQYAAKVLKRYEYLRRSYGHLPIG